MRQKLTAAITACALMVAGAAPAPAQTLDVEDLLGVLVGVGAIYALGRAIEKADDDRDHGRKVETRRAPVVAQEKSRPRAGTSSYRRLVPSACLRSYETRRGEVRGFSAHCLDRTMHRTARLPESCAMRIKTDRGRRTVYDPRCLRAEGWRRDDRIRAGAPRYRKRDD